MDEKTFWKLSWTWGFVMTLIGKIVFSVLQLLSYKPARNQYGYVIEIGEGWGGVSMGPYCLCEKKCDDHILKHEFGHAVQNCYFGPFQVLISLASATRYWYREYEVRVKGKKYSELPEYDSAWYEGMATKLGYEYAEKTNK